MMNYAVIRHLRFSIRLDFSHHLYLWKRQFKLCVSTNLLEVTIVLKGKTQKVASVLSLGTQYISGLRSYRNRHFAYHA